MMRKILAWIFCLLVGFSTSAQNISYEPEILGTIPEIDTGKTVGSLDGGVAVNLTGSATYEIPIKMAPGTNGMVPKIALTYSSQAGNGLLGKGWSLAGLSAISRNGRDYYHDGQSTPVQWNNNDALYLDGSRLHVTNGTLGTNNCEYATEQENWTRITQQGTFNNSADWFTVIAKDGTNIRYGELRDSRVKNNAGTEYLTWKISSTHDAFGNEVQYEYETINDENRLKRIFYTVNNSAGISASNEVRFVYKDRQDNNKYFVSGSAYKSNSLLEKIEVFNYEEGTVRSYVMSYIFDGDISLLQRVTEVGAGGSELNSTVFQYQSNIAPYALSNTGVSGVPAPNGTINPTSGSNELYDYLLSMDFNKDGYTDILSIKKTQTSSTFNYPLYGPIPSTIDSFFLCFRLNNKANYFNEVYNIPILGLSNFEMADGQSFKKILRRENFHIGDFDGDGNEDVAIFYRLSGVGSDYNMITSLKFYTNLKNVTSGGQPTVTVVSPPARLLQIPDDINPALTDAIHYSYAQTGDFDGDGVSEILTAIPSSTNVANPGAWNQYQLSTELQITSLKYGKYFEEVLPEPGSINSLQLVANAFRESKICSPVNMNGDAAQELFYIFNAAPNGAYIISIPRDPITGKFSSKLLSNPGYPTIYHGVNLGDFNGDGLTDVLTKTRDSRQLWEIGYSNGHDFGTPMPFNFQAPTGYDYANLLSFPYYLRPTDYTPLSDETPLITADFNGDGKSDVAHFYTTRKTINGASVNFSNLQVYYSTGFNSFRHQEIEIEADYTLAGQLNFAYAMQPQYHYNNYSLYLGDFNGDGKPDMMNWLGTLSYPNPYPVHGPNYLSIGAGQPNRLLTHVRNGFGIRDYVTYGKLNATALYTETHTSSYPFISINGPLYVVNSQQTSKGHFANDIIQNDFKYKNLYVLKDGRGILGFGEIQKSTPFDGGLHTAISLTTQTGYQAPFYLPTIQESKKYIDYLAPSNLISSQQSTSQTIAIGTAGRFKTRAISSEETNALSGTTKTTTYQSYDGYDNLTAVEEKIPGIEHSTRNITYAPAGGNTWTLFPCLPEMVTVNLSKNNTQTVTTTEFNTYIRGKVQTHKAQYGTAAEITTTNTYNTAGTLASQTVSAPNETPRTASYTYDSKHRFALSETNALGQTTSSTYDPRFSSTRTQTDFKGLTTTYQYNDFGKLLNTLLPDGRTLTERWYWQPAMRLTEPIMRKVVTDPAASQSYTDYSMLGNETEHGTKIWSGSGAADWSREVLTYNIQGQLIQKILPRRSASETVIQMDNTYDKYGRLIQTCTQHGCTNVTYTYIGSNLKIETIDPAGRVKYVIKDAADKLLESKDESGTLTYGYDGWGNVAQTSAGGTVLSSGVYDAYNRRQSMTETSAGTVSYTYTGYGELKSQTDAAGQTTQTEYDVLGRVWKTTTPEGTVTTEYYNNVGTGNGRQVKSITRQNTQGITEHSKTYSYDNLGRLVKTAYHNGRYTALTYDALSRLATQRYVSGHTVIYSYRDGHIVGMSGGGGQYWLEEVTGTGTAKQERRGNGKTSFATFDYGSLTRTQTTGVQDYNLTHDFTRGLITQRANNLAGVYDAFSYDNASRLIKTATGYSGSGTYPLPPPDQVQAYGNSSAGAGNIVTKTDIGTYSYANNPHQLSYSNNSTGALPTIRQEVSYASYHRPLTIAEGAKRAEFVYDGEGERSVMRMYTNSVLDYQKEYYDDGSVLYYNGSGQLQERVTPVASGNGIVWIAVTRPGGGGGGGPIDPPPVDGGFGRGSGSGESSTDKGGTVVLDDYANEPCCAVTMVYYPYTDHLGSVVALTDGQGNVVHRQAFDSWGRRRDANTWYTDDSRIPPTQYRWLWGYTGHEMLDEFGLINMNARLYDPKLGRMLSVDNYVSDATSALTYNRYSYANCNPISYIDPSGNEPITIAAALTYMAIGAAISGAAYTAQAAFSPGGLQRNFNFIDFATTTFTGGVLGGITAGVGSYFGPTATLFKDGSNFMAVFTHEAGRAAAHGGLGAFFSYAQGGDAAVGFLSSAFSTFASHALVSGGVELGDVGGAFFSAGMGAGTSYMQGGNPWIGAGAALMSYGLNQKVQDGKKKKDYGVKSPYENVDKVAGATGVSMTVQEKMIEHAAKQGEIGNAGRSVLKGVKILGKVSGFTQVATSGKELYDSPSISNGIKFGVNVLMVAIKVNPVVSIGMGILDLTGVTDKIYISTENHINNYRR